MKSLTLRCFGLAALFVLCAAGARPARAQLGLSAGLNFNRLTDVELNSQEATFDNTTGWHIELWYDLSLGPLALRPGLRYVNAGEPFQGLADLGSNVREDFSVNLLEVPLNVRFRLGSPVITPYIVGGPVLRFPVDVADELEDDLTISVAGDVGLGVEVPLGLVTFYPEILFTFGISRFVEDEFTIGSQAFQTDETQRLNTVMLRLGIGL